LAPFNPWAKHYQSAWENRSANHRLPKWLRIACLAYGRHEPNGHARFQRGELCIILGTPPKGGQPFRRADPATIRDAIATAIKYEWLDKDSCAECLIVPSHEIQLDVGNPNAPCPVHERRKATKRRKNQEQHDKEKAERRLKAV
jgi:hypothetical protein